MFLPFLQSSRVHALPSPFSNTIVAGATWRERHCCEMYVALTFCNQGRNGEIFTVCPHIETRLKPEERSMKSYFAHGDSAQREQTSMGLFDSVVHSAISCQLYTDKCMRTAAAARSGLPNFVAA